MAKSTAPNLPTNLTAIAPELSAVVMASKPCTVTDDSAFQFIASIVRGSYASVELKSGGAWGERVSLRVVADGASEFVRSANAEGKEEITGFIVNFTGIEINASGTGRNSAASIRFLKLYREALEWGSEIEAYLKDQSRDGRFFVPYVKKA